MICNKNDERYVNGYKRIYGNIVPLYVKSPIDCYTNGVSRYNENSTWKMGLDISGNKEWMEMYKLIWGKTEKQFNGSLENVVRKDAYINQKLITWGGQFKTNFHEADIPFGSCVKLTTVLKITSIYKQSGKRYPQVFMKKCKIVENRGSAKWFLDGFQVCPPLDSLKNLS